MDRLNLQNKIIYGFRRYKYALLILLVGLCLMLIPGKSRDTPVQNTVQTTQPQKEQGIHVQLAKILSQIQGAGRVEVMLTVAAGEKTVYQTDEDISNGENGTTRIETVIITNENRGQAGLIQQVNPPVYLGAIVVCQGADHAAVRLAIVEAVCKVTGLGADRVSVLKMK